MIYLLFVFFFCVDMTTENSHQFRGCAMVPATGSGLGSTIEDAEPSVRMSTH